MSRYSDQELRNGLRNGSREVLFYLAGRYFQTSRRWLRTKGFRDADTPLIFSDALVRLYREAQHKQFPAHVDVRELFSNILRNYVRELRQPAGTDDPESERIDAAARCFSILDDGQRQLLAGWYADRLNFEQLAERYGYGNSVIAETEVDRALHRLEQILDARLSLASDLKDPLTGEMARMADRFIDGSSTGSERSGIEGRLGAESGFLARITLRTWAIKGVRQAADEAMAKEIAENTGYRKSLLPFGLKMLIGFVAVVLVFLLGWNYLGNESGTERPVLSFRWLNKVGSIIHLSKQKPEEPVVLSDTSVAEPLPAVQDVDSLSAPAAGLTADSTAPEEPVDVSDQDIVVRKDQLLIALEITPQLLSRSSESKTVSLADAAARKLNPEAGLAESPEISSSMEVEFWLSPVNYKGYRWNRELLQLYGIESPEEVRLYLFDRRLLLRNGNELFELVSSSDFQTYHPVREPELISLCK